MSVLYPLALVDALLIQIKVIEELQSYYLRHLLGSRSLGTDLILSLFTNPNVILNLCDFLSSVEQKREIFYYYFFYVQVPYFHALTMNDNWSV